MKRHRNWAFAARGFAWTAAALSLAACGVPPDDERAAIEREFLNSAESGELFAVIKQEYPDQIDELISQIQAVPAAERSEERGQEIGAQWLLAFMEQIGPDAVKAPADTLLVWSATEAELYEALQRSAPEDCAKMTMGGLVMLDDSNNAARAAIERRNAAMVRSAASGRDDPQDYAEPNQDELNRLGDSIAATGIDPELQALFGQVPEMQALPASDQCELGVAFYQGITNLPDDVEPVIAAYMLSPE